MSNSRAFRRRVARHQLAGMDGKVIHIDACCRMELILGPTRLNVRHDDDCPALRPHTTEGMNARLRANQAVARALGELGITTAVVVA
ncbi:MAG TPA: hypothetical protein VIU87_21250 [Mycobacterium sp.]